ncbi:P-loop NTPase family protein [Sphingobacterium chungjuense]|uniref:ATPase n=1 Tax=Sphingobacterium chungjuense TaxID=2675553 RepID=UPI001408DFE3|nr:ATPase [Sphingobacterium chungjuense]
MITPNHFEQEKVFRYIYQKGQQLYGSHFALCPHDKDVIMQLSAYFLRDEQRCEAYQLDLGKGIMLTGPIGSGKTSLMTIMRIVGNNGFVIKNARDVTFEFIQDCYEVIHRYSRGKLYQPDHRSYCFDYLGIENNIKYYGNECNVMAEILLSRYDLYVSKGLTTHITTNLSATEIEEAYGNCLRSRLREMVNLIAFDQEVSDKRK